MDKSIHDFDKCNKCLASPTHDIYDGGDGERAWLCDKHYEEWLAAKNVGYVLPVIGGRVGYKWAIRPSRFWQFLHDDAGHVYPSGGMTYSTLEEATAGFAPDATVTILEVVEDRPGRAWRLYWDKNLGHQALMEMALGVL